LTTSFDTKITDTNPTTGTYASMSISAFATPQSKTAANAANYNWVIQGANGTAKQVYEFVQYKLRYGNTADIDSNTNASFVKYGEVTPDLLKFVGDSLYVIYQTVGPTGGVFIDGILSNNVDINNVYFYDNTNLENKYKYAASLRVNLGDNILADLTSKITIFFTTNGSGGDYGTIGGTIVKDSSNNDMSFTLGTYATSATIIGQKYVDFAYDYDGNNQRWPLGQDAPITAVALGLNTAQYVKTTGIIAKSKSNSVSLVAPLERNYNNPA
jgi:hypothetical protein